MSRHSHLLALLLALPAWAAVTLNPETGVSGVIAPGATITIGGHFEGITNRSVVLQKLKDASQGAPRVPLDAEVAPSNQTLTVHLPSKLPVGDYYLKLADGDVIVPGSFSVQPEKITLESIHPATAYRSGPANSFDFDLIGEDFSGDVSDDDVRIGGIDIIQTRAKDEGACRATGQTCLWSSPDGRGLHVVNYSGGSREGLVRVSASVGSVTTGERPLVLARRSGPAVLGWSFLLTAALFWLVHWVVSGGLRGKRLGRERLTVLQTFIFDPQTNSYSLSKFQLLVFSVTFIFGYLYVFLCRWLVQWVFTLPDVPPEIAGLLGISAGTTVASAGLTAARGSKGAGLQYPTGTDMIATGGVVVPERFQFFVWTIVACCGFTALLVGQDPAAVNKFPNFPDGLLYVMGVSASGYLLGKAARKPGPVIQDVAVDPGKNENDPAILIVLGQNLGSDGSFYVDNIELPLVPDRASGGAKTLTTPTPQEGAPDTAFATKLRIEIADPPPVDVKHGEHRFRIVNKDGQFADLSFTNERPAILSVADEGRSIAGSTKQITSSDELHPVSVRGDHVPIGSKFAWNDRDAAATPRGADAFSLMLVPGKRDTTGTLSVRTPGGFLAVANVDVRGPIAPTPTQPEPKAGTPQSQPAPANTQETGTEPAKKAPADPNQA